MRILFLDLYLPDLIKNEGKSTGGASVRINALAIGLRLNGNKVGVLTWAGANEYVGELPEYDLVETYPLKKGIKYLRIIYLNFYTIYKAMARYKPDITMPMGNSLNVGITSLAAFLLKIPIGYIVTNDKDVDNRVRADQSMIARVLFLFALSKSTLIVCQNSYQFDNLSRRYPDKKIKILYNPILVPSSLKPLIEKEKRKYVAWIGVFSIQKNLPVLLDIVKSLPNILFKIAGSLPSNSALNRDGKENEKIQSVLTKLGEQSNVELVGYLKRENILQFLSHAYLLLNTSHYEGFSNTFLESFMVGTPIVTRSATDPDNIIARNNLGKVVGSYEELATGISDTINSPGFSFLSERCRNYVINQHEARNIAKELAEFLESSVDKD